MKFDFIAKHRREFSVTRMCKVLGVSRSGFFAWLKRSPSRRQRDDEKLQRRIRAIFDKSGGTYGSPRIHAELRAQGCQVSVKRVARLMRQGGMRARRKQGYARRKKAAPAPAAPNILQQEFSASARNQKWLADIAYIATQQGWLYLAVVMDAYSRRIIGWSMRRRADSRLARNALKMALMQRDSREALVHHSDRGSQYSDRAYQKLLSHNGIQCSMSGLGNCYDNAMVESFFATLKTECAHNRFESIAEARRAIVYYIEAWYNRERRHSSLGYRSPMSYEGAQH